jgi:hypothetical protein
MMIFEVKAQWAKHLTDMEGCWSVHFIVLCR